MCDYRQQVAGLRGAAKGLREINMPRTAKQMEDAADAIEELLAKNNELWTQLHVEGRSLIEELSQKTQQLPTWISVEARLPPIYKNVLSCDKYGLAKENYMISDKSWSVGYHITHWMPLPAPPKGVE